MRWIAFAIILYLVAALQSSVAPLLALHGVWPDFILITGVYFALVAKPSDARLACWITGLTADLLTLSYDGYSNVGIRAITMGFLAVLIVKMREFVFRESVWSQLFFTFVAKFAIESVAGLHMLYLVGRMDQFGELLVLASCEAAYTAALAPYGHWLLRQLRGPLGVGAVPRWA